MGREQQGVTFHFRAEPPDRGVGIMSESFVAWKVDAAWKVDDADEAYCQMVEYESDFERCKFGWENVAGTPQPRPAYAETLERMLKVFADNHYDHAEIDALIDSLPED